MNTSSKWVQTFETAFLFLAVCSTGGAVSGVFAMILGDPKETSDAAISSWSVEFGIALPVDFSGVWASLLLVDCVDELGATIPLWFVGVEDCPEEATGFRCVWAKLRFISNHMRGGALLSSRLRLVHNVMFVISLLSPSVARECTIMGYRCYAAKLWGVPGRDRSGL